MAYQTKVINLLEKWYYGIKLHAVVSHRPGRLPVSVSLMASGAAQHDLSADKQIMIDHAFLNPRKLFVDKAYCDAEWKRLLKQGPGSATAYPSEKA